MARVRTKNETLHGPGTQKWRVGLGAWNTQPGTACQDTSVSQDFTGSRDRDNPLTITHIRHGIMPVSGRMVNSGLYESIFAGYVPVQLRSNNWASHLVTGLPNDGALAATLLARTNPSRSEVSLPTFVGELKDLPGMVRDIGRFIILSKKFPKKFRTDPLMGFRANWLGKTYLGWKFGLAPLVGDINKMLQFQELTARRVKELEKLRTSRGIKRRMSLGTSTSSSQSATGSYTTSNFASLTYRSIKFTQQVAWGTVRWTPTTPLVFRDSEELRARAYSLVTGMNPSSVLLSTWELLPWSWLADWFLGVQNVLEAKNNQIGVVPRNLNIMRKTTTSYSAGRTDTWPVQGGYCSGQLVSLSRTQPNPSLNASLPFLNGGQLSILSALAVVKFRQR